MEPFSELFSFIEGVVELVGGEHGSDTVENLPDLAAPGVETGASPGLSTGQEGRGRTQSDRIKTAGTADVCPAGLWTSLNLLCNEGSP